jgi:prevent-host-death family protein
MSISIAQSRQQLSSLIDAAQSMPQIITKRNAPVAVLVSADYFKRTEAAVHSSDSFYNTIMAARAAYMPVDDTGLGDAGSPANRAEAWTRANSFADKK